MKKLLLLLVTLTLASTSHAYYQAEQGRWLNRDPIGERDAGALYGFTGNNGVNIYDRFGLRFGEGSLIGQATQEQVNAIRSACSALNSITGKVDGKPCYVCTIQTDTASVEDVENSLRNFDNTHVQGHGDSNRNRYFSDGTINDLDMHTLSDIYGNQCTTHGCYADDNPDDTTTEAHAYSEMQGELGAYPTNLDCCPSPTTINLVFGPK